MKIRLALTFSIGRDRQVPADEPREVDEKGSFIVERAEPVPIGFAIRPTNHQDPFEGDDRA